MRNLTKWFFAACCIASVSAHAQQKAKQPMPESKPQMGADSHSPGPAGINAPTSVPMQRSALLEVVDARDRGVSQGEQMFSPYDHHIRLTIRNTGVVASKPNLDQVVLECVEPKNLACCSNVATHTPPVPPLKARIPASIAPDETFEMDIKCTSQTTGGISGLHMRAYTASTGRVRHKVFELNSDSFYYY